MKHKTIAVLGVTYPFRGGISHYSTLLVRELRKRAGKIRFLTLNRQYPALLFPGKTQYDDSQNVIVEDNEAIIDSINPLSWLKAAWRLKKDAPALVLVQWWHPFFGLSFGTIANILSRFSDVKICFLCHNVLPHESTAFDRLLLRYAYRGAHYFIVHSDEDRTNLLKLKPQARVSKTLHPTYAVFGETNLYEKSEAKKRLGLSLKPNVLLFFGLVRKYKGLRYLIQAMHEVVKHLDCTLLIAGEFYEGKDDCLTLIEELNLWDNVVLVDAYISNEDVPLYFCSADVVVLPYIEATQSGIVQIAFGLNKPVITTRVGGLPEAVDDGQTGLIVDKESPEELAKAIVYYYTERCETKFSQTIERNASQFGWEAEIRAIESLINGSGSTT